MGDQICFRVGDGVRLKGQSASGKVAALKGAEVVVHFSNLSLTCKSYELEAAQGDEQATWDKRWKSARSGPLQDVPRRAYSQSLNVRHHKVVDAIAKVERFLDDALLAGHLRVRILHGKGDGVLRGCIGKRLEELDFVKSFGSELQHSGGSGVTVVELSGR